MSKRHYWVHSDPHPTETRLCPLDHEDDDGNPLAREAGPGMTVCRSHRTQLARDISRLPELHEALELQLHPDGPSLQPFTTGQGETAPFVNERAARLRGRIVEVLTSWAAFVCDQRKVTAPASLNPLGYDPQTLARFLGIHVGWIATQDWAKEPVEHFHEVSSACYSAAYPMGWHRVVCGRCLEVTYCDVTTRLEVRCPGELVVMWTEPADLEPEGVDCTVCGKTWPHRYWTQLGQRLQAVS